MIRTSKVDNLKINSTGLSAVIHIGDSNHLNTFARVLAIQRQKELYYDNEGNFKLYGIFSRPLPIPPLDEAIRINSVSLNPLIKVGSISAVEVTASSILHIGSSDNIQAEARTLHIRHIETVENNSDQSIEEG
ncbi:spore germination protein GerPE [Bacillus tuaregi]|uniref:spore germination protein GerPE n=1 Tax=Bacillus tuaregi TaxID=1816695 RepID=UPI000A042648|nr:spore germination protein GerPE [Bacillus tuaregi]